jgi:hypothetical protein
LKVNINPKNHLKNYSGGFFKPKKEEKLKPKAPFKIKIG